MTEATKSSIHHFIQNTVNSSAAEKSGGAPHVLLLFDASGCVTKSDLAVLRSMVPTILNNMKAEASLICVNHHARHVTPYDPSEFLAPEDVHGDPRFARDLDMLGVLAERLSDPGDNYDGVVVMTEGKFPPFSAHALHDAVVRKSAGSDNVVLPPIGFFLFSAGAIPSEPTYTMTRHVAL
ncbi:hypothetical protein [Herbaspirillum sp. alder98]|uniref:hypothetical protein n=1 Tax=Herbaspirillum sp. alder98 TaxID=2913096 RepID=UPI001CD8FC7B|nr:hypothetical protein [Herbaspirillum sp. alder98]MCA1325006.1 hypothetical protein [Herbaspirillum sp. alder98]